MKRSTVIRRLLALALVLGMALTMAPSLSLPAYAADTVPQIIINPNEYVSKPVDPNVKDEGDKEALETRFWAYQIFTGTLDMDSVTGFDPDAEINALENVEWGESIQEDKQEDLLGALGSDTTLASTLGITFALMLETGDYYLGTTSENVTPFEEYSTAYNTEAYWEDESVGGYLTTAGRAALEAAFNKDLENLTIGDVFTAAYEKNKETYQTNGAHTAATIIADFTPATGNVALAQAFYAIVFDREQFGDDAPGEYKYLTTGNPFQKSRWVEGTSGVEGDGYWGIGEWDGKNLNSAPDGSLYLPAGYYMIRDAYSEKDNEGKAGAAYMAAVFGYGIIDVKAEGPSVTKAFGVGSIGGNKGANYELGGTIYFTLRGTLPENYFTGYEGYPYIFEDTLDPGLTFDSIVRVYVRNRRSPTSPQYDYYLVDRVNATGTNTGEGYRLEEEDDGTKITISFPNLKNVKGKITNQSTWAEGETIQNPITGRSEIFVVYTAKLNEGANINDNLGNLNTVKLRYANEPLWDPAAVKKDGTWDNAWGDAPTGQVTAFVRAYDFGIQLLVKGVPNDEDPDPVETDAPQTDAGETKEPEPLSGAGFALRKGTDENVQYAILHKNKTPDFKGNDPQGRAEYTYYLAGWVSEDDLYTYLAGGDTLTRTTRSWSEALDAGAEIGGIAVPAEGEYYASVVTEEDGLVRVVGLNGGSTYYLEEVITPTDYDTVDEISIWFSAGYLGGVLNELTADVNGADAEEKILSGYSFQGNYDTTYQELVARLTVEQEPGGEIVDTGGMGTTLFYIGGGALLAGAALLLIFSGVKKRSGKHTR